MNLVDVRNDDPDIEARRGSAFRIATARGRNDGTAKPPQRKRPASLPAFLEATLLVAYFVISSLFGGGAGVSKR
jgi:hypothetical protein